MTKEDFILLCFKYNIDPYEALKEDDISRALLNDEYIKLDNLLKKIDDEANFMNKENFLKKN